MNFQFFQQKITPLLGIFLVIVLTACQTGSGRMTQIPSDPAVQIGTLSNGLKYYIMENDQPHNKAELQLIVDAGSVLEDDDQQGLAHFLEHMAFNGTKMYPKHEISSFLESIGVEFGPDLNAYTSFDETVYQISLPTDKEGTLRTGIEILAQWAFHINLETDEVHRERGVVLDEHRLGRGAHQRFVKKMGPTLFKNSRYPNRMPIGKAHIIESAEVEPLQRFYDDWYRPDLMAVIAVGDFSATEVEQYIRKFFSDAPKPSRKKPQRPRHSVPHQSEVRFAFESDPEEPLSSVNIFNRYPANGRNDYRTPILETLFYMMINQRLDEIAQQEDAPFITPSAYTFNQIRNIHHSVLTAYSNPEGLEQALKAIFTEYERISRYGFLKSELKRAVKSMHSSAKSEWKNRENTKHLSFLNDLVTYHLEGTPMPSRDWKWKQTRRQLSRIRPKDFNKLIEERLMDQDYAILIAGSEEAENYRFGLDRAMEIRRDVTNATIEPWVDNVVDNTLVSTAPTPGTIRSETYDEKAGIYRWVLSNGATVYIKPTDFAADQVLFSAFSPGGLSQVSDQDYISAAMATTAVQFSGLGDLSAIALQKTIAGKNVNLSFDISDYQESFHGHASPEDLETLFQLMHLCFTATRADQSAWNSYSKRLAAHWKNQERNPKLQYSRKVNQVLYDDNPRAQDLRAEDIASIDLQKSIDIFRQRFSNAADFTFSFVGAVDMDAIRQLCETWIAGLPATEQRETKQDVGLDYFSGPKREEIRAGIDTASLITMAWTEDTPWSYDSLYDLVALSSVLDLILIEEVREEASGTYGIRSNFALNSAPKENYLFHIDFSADAPRVDELINLVNASIANLKENGPDDEYVTKAAENQRVRYRENLESNRWWLNQINFLLRHDLGWEYAMEKNRWYDALTAAQIQEAANKYLASENYAEIILFPKNFE